jgi:hypothetical protein
MGFGRVANDTRGRGATQTDEVGLGPHRFRLERRASVHVAGSGSVARTELAGDPRVTFYLGDGGTFLESCDTTFDLIYADAWPGKYSHRDAALRLLIPAESTSSMTCCRSRTGEDHAPQAAALRETLQALNGFAVTTLDWSTGLIVCVKQRGAGS